MNNQFERDLSSLCERLEISHNFDSVNQKERIIGILSAIKGYMTECGTTYEQDVLLREIGVLPPKAQATNLAPRDNSNGVHMQYCEWQAAVKAGAYTDDDGFAHWATETQVSDRYISPSRAHYPVPAWVTHVVWYNR